MKRVIIIGASYAGLYAAKEFLNNPSYEVIVFDKNKYHYIQVESYGFVANKYDVLDVSVNIEDYIKKLNGNISFCNNEITYFDSKEKKVVDNNNNEYNYDYLILATGSLTNFPIQVPNIKKFSTGIKNLKKASGVRQRFESIINKVVYKKNTSDKDFNIVIGGAGLSGVEIAAQMADYLNKAKKENSDFSKIKIVIVDGMKTVLPNMDERLVNECHRRLEELDIKIHLGSFIKDVTEEYILLTNDEKIHYDEFIFTGGVKGVTLDSSQTYEVNKINQYITDEYLHLNTEENIFAIGDIAQVMYEDKYYAPTAQLAIKSAQYVSSHIQNKNLEPFKPKLNGTLISLGGNYAIGLINDSIFIKGFIAYYLKKYVTNLHKKKFI